MSYKMWEIDIIIENRNVPERLLKDVTLERARKLDALFEHMAEVQCPKCRKNRMVGIYFAGDPRARTCPPCQYRISVDREGM